MKNLVTVIENIGRVVTDSYYEMTHVTEVGSRGYRMANAVGCGIYLLLVLAVLVFINSNTFDSLMGSAMKFLEERGIRK